jgi:hypothetical protein
MADTYITIGSTGMRKKVVDLGDGTYADAVVVFGDAGGGQVADDELVLAKGTGSTGGLGKIGTVPDDGWLYVRCDNTDGEACSAIDFRVQSTKKHDVQLYKARSIVDNVTITVDSLADTETVLLNGLTYTAEATANTVNFASREFSVAGDNDEDAAALAAIINADYAVVTAGTSVAATDKLVITTDEGEHTIVAAAAANYPAGQYKLDATAATEAASIIAAINHKDNVTCATASAGDTVVIVKDGTTYTFTGHATTTTASKREWDIADNNTAAAAIATLVNDATYGVDGITASASGAVVSFTRDSLDDTFTLTTSNATRLKTEAAGGVPGVIAAASPLAAGTEFSITPTWTAVLTVEEEGDQLTVTDIDCPGILATASTGGLVTLTPGTPGAPAGQELATVIQAISGTAGAHAVVSQAATLAGLLIPPDITSAFADVAANSTTAGAIYTLPTGGYEQCYIGVMNDSGDASAATIVVGATKRL